MCGKQQCSDDLDFLLALQMSTFLFHTVHYNVCPFDLGISVIPEFHEIVCLFVLFFLQDPTGCNSIFSTQLAFIKMDILL